MAGRLDTQLALPLSVDINLDRRIEQRTAFGRRLAALEARNNELAAEVERLRAASSRRRLERDLHDGVQSELVALLVRLRLAEEDPKTSPALAGTFQVLADHATAALESVREIVHGIYPRPLAMSGVFEALRTRAARASIDMSIVGTVPRSTRAVEEAVYFACLEAIQNVIKHAGRGAQVTVRVHHDPGSLAVCIADDGRGFDPDHAGGGAGLQNIRDRIRHRGGTVNVTSPPGCGTVLTIAVPWPPRSDRGR
jgi:signal transduction histidine kinase